MNRSRISWNAKYRTNTQITINHSNTTKHMHHEMAIGHSQITQIGRKSEREISAENTGPSSPQLDIQSVCPCSNTTELDEERSKQEQLIKDLYSLSLCVYVPNIHSIPNRIKMIYEFPKHQEALKDSILKQEAHCKQTKATKSQLILLKSNQNKESTVQILCDLFISEISVALNHTKLWMNDYKFIKLKVISNWGDDRNLFCYFSVLGVMFHSEE